MCSGGRGDHINSGQMTGQRYGCQIGRAKGNVQTHGWGWDRRNPGRTGRHLDGVGNRVSMDGTGISNFKNIGEGRRGQTT